MLVFWGGGFNKKWSAANMSGWVLKIFDCNQTQLFVFGYWPCLVTGVFRIFFLFLKFLKLSFLIILNLPTSLFSDILFEASSLGCSEKTSKKLEYQFYWLDFHVIGCYDPTETNGNEIMNGKCVQIYWPYLRFKKIMSQNYVMWVLKT